MLFTQCSNQIFHKWLSMTEICINIIAVYNNHISPSLSIVNDNSSHFTDETSKLQLHAIHFISVKWEYAFRFSQMMNGFWGASATKMADFRVLVVHQFCTIFGDPLWLVTSTFKSTGWNYTNLCSITLRQHSKDIIVDSQWSIW